MNGLWRTPDIDRVKKKLVERYGSVIDRKLDRVTKISTSWEDFLFSNKKTMIFIVQTFDFSRRLNWLNGIYYIPVIDCVAKNE